MLNGLDQTCPCCGKKWRLTDNRKYRLKSNGFFYIRCKDCKARLKVYSVSDRYEIDILPKITAKELMKVLKEVPN